MYLLYLDASGSPHPNDITTHFALLGICIHEGTWFALEKRMAGVRKKYQFPGLPFEFHAKDICIDYPEQKNVPDFFQMDWQSRRAAILKIRVEKKQSYSGKKLYNKNAYFRLTDPYIHLSRTERSQLYEDALDTIGNHQGIKLFGEIIDKRHFYNVNPGGDIFQQAFSQVISRFDAFLQRVNKNREDGVDNGLLLFDNEPTYETLITNLFKTFRLHGHQWGAIKHVIEAPLFVDSKNVTSVQAVDLCSYALRRYVEKKAVKDSFEEKNLMRVFHCFDRFGSNLHGIRHFCERNSCSCRICIERGFTAG